MPAISLSFCESEAWKGFSTGKQKILILCGRNISWLWAEIPSVKLDLAAFVASGGKLATDIPPRSGCLAQVEVNHPWYDAEEGEKLASLSVCPSVRFASTNSNKY